MKKCLAVTALFIGHLCLAQDTTLPRITKDTLFTTSGYKLVTGKDVKVGMGSTPDGDFKFIRISRSSFFNYSGEGAKGGANSANALPRNQSGLKFKVKAVETLGNKKHGYVYYAKIGFGMINYEIDVENAIASGELVVPDEYKPKPKQQQVIVQMAQQTSVADELFKLKKLKDDGILTQDEYDIQKKKVLDKN